MSWWFMDEFSQLRLSEHTLKITAKQNVALPDYLGSTLRGAFGAALKNVVCIVNHRECARCLVNSRCTYPYVFETPVPEGLELLKGQSRAPHPFIITPPVEADHLWSGKRKQYSVGDSIYFKLLLMGRAIDSLPYVIYAFSRMAENGLGFERGRFLLEQIIDSRGKVVYDSSSGTLSSDYSYITLSEAVSKRLATLKAGKRVRLRFLTPVRIRTDGDLQTALDFELLIRSILRRVSLLMAVHGSAALHLDFRGLIERAAKVRTLRCALRWIDLERYSNRQHSRLKIGGMVGPVVYQGELEQFLPLLVAGELLNIGNGTGFGLGAYRIEEVEE